MRTNACGWDVGGAEASVVARPEMIGAGHNAYLEAAWAVRRFGLVVGIAGLVWPVWFGWWRYGRLVRGVVGWSVAVGWLAELMKFGRCDVLAPWW